MNAVGWRACVAGLVLGVAAEAWGGEPTVKGIEVGATRGWVAADGRLHVTGEVRNTGGTWLQRVRLELVLLDEAGRAARLKAAPGTAPEAAPVAAPERFDLPRRSLPPGESAVFEHVRSTDDLGAPYVAHAVRVTAAELLADPARVELAEVRQSQVGGQRLVRGRLSAAAGTDCVAPALVLGLYDAEGALVGVRRAALDSGPEGRLAAGGMQAFVVRAEVDAPSTTVKAWPSCGP